MKNTIKKIKLSKPMTQAKANRISQELTLADIMHEIQALREMLVTVSQPVPAAKVVNHRAKQPRPSHKIAIVPSFDVPAFDADFLATVAGQVEKNYHAGQVNEKIQDACVKRGRDSDMRQWLTTGQNRVFKASYKAANMTLNAADDALNAYFD